MSQPRFAPLPIICFSLMVSLPACSKPEPDTGDCFRDASIVDADTLMPPLASDSPSRTVLAQVERYNLPGDQEGHLYGAIVDSLGDMPRELNNSLLK